MQDEGSICLRLRFSLDRQNCRTEDEEIVFQARSFGLTYRKSARISSQITFKFVEGENLKLPDPL